MRLRDFRDRKKSDVDGLVVNNASHYEIFDLSGFACGKAEDEAFNLIDSQRSCMKIDLLARLGSLRISV